MTVAQAFNLAFSSWKDNQEKKKENGNRKCDHPSSIKLNKQSCTENSEDENLLIDLRSPGDTLEDKTLTKTVLLRIDSRDTEHEEDMDHSFAK